MLFRELALSEAKLLCDIVGEICGRRGARVKMELTVDAKPNQKRLKLLE